MTGTPPPEAGGGGDDRPPEAESTADPTGSIDAGSIEASSGRASHGRPDAAAQQTPMADADVDAAFEQIIAGMAGRMSWDADAAGLDAQADSVARSRTPPPTPGPDEAIDTAEDRRRRREQRRAQRAEELAEFNAAQAEKHNEMLFDDEHFVPPEPPPLPRPRARTWWALALLTLGVVFLAGPPLLNISGNATLVLGLLLVLGGFSLLISGLNARRGDPGDADGWDDGARL
jgi:hypothetical protein